MFVTDQKKKKGSIDSEDVPTEDFPQDVYQEYRERMGDGREDEESGM